MFIFDIFAKVKRYIELFPLAFIALTFSSTGFGQARVSDSVIFTPLLDISYALQFPGGDMADRFGVNSNIGGSFFIKTKKNVLYGASATFMFGNNVKEDGFMLSLADESGSVPGISGLYADVLLYQRGFSVEGHFGKIFPVFGPNMNSGIMAYAGAGYLQHNIRIEDRNGEVPLFGEDYRKGYDRLTGGFTTSQFLGYRHLGNQRLINFFIGAEFRQAFTTNLRGYNYDTQSRDTESRLDLLYGIRFGVTLPFYKKPPQEYYFN